MRAFNSGKSPGHSYEKDELVAKAYRLGLEVGYFAHMEDVGWAQRERRSLVTRASRIGAQEDVDRAYLLGVKSGHERRQSEFFKRFPWSRVKPRGITREVPRAVGREGPMHRTAITTPSKVSRKGMGRLVGLLLLVLGILVGTFSALGLGQLTDSSFVSEDSPPEMRSLLSIPQALSALGSVAGVLLAAAGIAKYLKDTFT